MRIGSLFSGIGGLELGIETGLNASLRDPWFKAHPIWQVEKDPFCRDILKQHWGCDVFEDVTEVGDLPQADLICGGFPCQDISPAGKRAGLSGAKSGLWNEFRRIVNANRPRWVVVENSGHGWRSYVPAVRGQLWRDGYPGVCFHLRASDIGAWHRRQRCFIVADSHGSLLRLQSRGKIRSCWDAAILATFPGIPWEPADADGKRESQPSWRIQEEWGRLGNRSRRTVEPSLARGSHGVPDRVDREKALGNAVVPQCAEVVGRFIANVMKEDLNER